MHRQKLNRVREVVRVKLGRDSLTICLEHNTPPHLLIGVCQISRMMVA